MTDELKHINYKDFVFDLHFHHSYVWNCNICGEDLGSDEREMYDHYDEHVNNRMKEIEEEAIKEYFEHNIWIFKNWNGLVRDVLGSDYGDEYDTLTDYEDDEE